MSDIANIPSNPQVPEMPFDTVMAYSEMVQFLEHELVQLLVDNIPADKRAEAGAGSMNGPVVNLEGRSDIVTNQNQVDDLLASLGF